MVVNALELFSDKKVVRLLVPLVAGGLLVSVLVINSLFTTAFERERLGVGMTTKLARDYWSAALLAAEENDYKTAEHFLEFGQQYTTHKPPEEVSNSIFPELSTQKKLLMTNQILESYPKALPVLVKKAELLAKLRMAAALPDINSQLIELDPNNSEVLGMIESLE